MHQEDSKRPAAAQHQDGSWLGDALRSVTRFGSERPRLTLCLVLLLAFVCVGLTVQCIDFKTERADLIDPDAPFHRRWIQYTEAFGDASDIVVVVEADTSAAIKRVLEDLGARLAAEPELFINVLYKYESGRLRRKGLHYLSPEQLETGLSRFAEYRPILQGQWDLIRLDALISRLRYQLDNQLRQAQSTSTSREPNPLLQHTKLLTGSMAEFLNDPDEFHSPWPDLLPVDPQLRTDANQIVYLLNDEGTIGFLKTHPAGEQNGFGGATRSIDRLRELIGEVATAHTSAQISITGIPVLENDEMRRSQTDMLNASLVSFAGVGLLLFLGFRGVRHPLLALLMLAIGLAWGFGYTTLAIGHLNILSVSFAVILIGLGIDFAIHYLARYLELRHAGRQLRPALLETSSGVGTGIITAAVTTALAFFCASFTPFLGIAELGIISGGGIILCAAATFVVLPALISLADQHVEPKKLPTPFEGHALRLITSRFPLTVMLVSGVVIAGIGLQAVGFEEGRWKLRIRYDDNLLNLQAAGLESIEVQKRVFHNAQASLLFAVSVAETPGEARALRQKFESLPSVHHVEELASRLPAHPSEETQLLVQAFGAQLSRLPEQPPRLSGVNPAVVGRTLEDLYRTLRRRRDRVASNILETLDAFLDRFERLSLADQAHFLNAFQQRTAAALLAQFRTFAVASDAEPVTLADLPIELTSRFVSAQGKWLLQIYPQEQIWEIGPLSRFVADVRSIDPDATGTPLQNYEASRQILESYRSAALYAFAVICVVLLVDFLRRKHKLLTLLPPLAVVLFTAMTIKTRGGEINPIWLVVGYVGMSMAIAAVLDFHYLRDVVLTMLPPLAGGVLMFGMLGLLGLDLNPANLIVLPLVLGIGVDDGVHVVHDFRMQRGCYRTSSSTINAIVLTSMTSMIGFGSMMFAAHRGLYSLGLVLVIGIGSCLFVSLVTLPAILMLVDRYQRKSNGSSGGGGADAFETRHAQVA